MRTYTATTVTVGSGRSIHWGSDCGTFCGAAHRNGFFTEPKLVNAETATCKRCIKIMVIQAAEAHELALETHQEVLDAEAVKAAGVEVGQMWTSQDADVEDAEVTSVNVGRLGAMVYYTIKTGERAGMSCSLPLAWFMQFWARKEVATEEAKRAEFAAAAQELKDMDLVASAKLVELVSGAPEGAYPEAVKLDTWLTEGLVLVGPATDSLYVFENWGPGGAVLRHVDTGALETVAQADVIEWKYLPGVGSEEILPVEVRLGDVIKFHAEGAYRKVRSIVRHGDTGLFSFSIEGSTIEFVRHVGEFVTRKELPAPRS